MAKKPSKTKKADIKLMASMNFEPWTHADDEWVPPTNEEWARLADPHLISVRLAWVTMHRYKPELMKMMEEMDDDAGKALMDYLAGGIDFFKGMLAVMEGAEARILCAGAAVIAADKTAAAKVTRRQNGTSGIVGPSLKRKRR